MLGAEDRLADLERTQKRRLGRGQLTTILLRERDPAHGVGGLGMFLAEESSTDVELFGGHLHRAREVAAAVDAVERGLAATGLGEGGLILRIEGDGVGQGLHEPVGVGTLVPDVLDFRQIVPSDGLPPEVEPMDANNNLDIAWHEGRLFLAFRTAPDHFASSDPRLYVVSTSDEQTWRYEGLFDLDTDGRVISLLTFSKILFPGLRLGWVLADPEVIRRLVRTNALWTAAWILRAALLLYWVVSLPDSRM